MDIESILTIAIPVISYIFGKLAKKFNWVESKYIPIQNIVIGMVVAIIYYCVVDNSNIMNAFIMAFSGLMAGGTYDLLQIKEEEE